MRRITTTLALTLVVVASVGITGTASAADSDAVRDQAIAWLAPQVTDQGALISPYTSAPDPGMTAQAALAFAGAGAVPATVEKMIGYLQANVDAYVAPGGSADSPGALAWLILDAVATDGDPTNFGGVNLVARLEATQQSDGLFGSADPSYDGVFRQGLVLVALSSVGTTNTSGLAWLQGQQCADGGFVAFRADTSTVCPAVDPATFSGADTNSTALAAMALAASGDDDDAAAAMNWLRSVRTSEGGFAYLGDASLQQDANSTGLVALAFQTVEGSQDAQSVAALASLQVPQSGDPLDAGGIAYQSGDPLTPDLMGTTQALLGLASQGLPFVPVTTTEPPSSTSTSTPSSTSGPAPTTTVIGTGSTPAVASQAVATPVSATPTYTG